MHAKQFEKKHCLMHLIDLNKQCWNQVFRTLYIEPYFPDLDVIIIKSFLYNIYGVILGSLILLLKPDHILIRAHDMSNFINYGIIFLTCFLTSADPPIPPTKYLLTVDL